MRLRRVFSFRVLRFVTLAAFAWVILAWAAAETLIVHASLAQADVIIVLSGSSAYLERTKRAAELFNEGRAPFVLLTDDHTRGGWSNALQRNPFFVERATDELIKAGVPAERIKIIPGLASSTHDEALILRDYASAQRLSSVLVVTSAYHSRRALRTLRQTFAGTATTVGLEPAPIGSTTPSTVFWWLRPEGWRTVGGEYVKLGYYWFRYR
jgi:uncharacterized SAM-binding protein YcdF (DUF218 family)